MLDHHIQRTILYRLAFADHMSFSELQPDGLENKLFTYHLKKTLVAGFVTKNPDGSYSLSAKGRRVGKGAHMSDDRLIDRAYSILLIGVRRGDTWLLYRRNTQPLRGYLGFLQARPTPSVSITESAASALFEKTGLTGSCTHRGHAFLGYMRGNELESFVHATVLVCEDPVGELTQQDETGEYAWIDSPDFSTDKFLPSLPDLLPIIDGQTVFVEATYQMPASS